MTENTRDRAQQRQCEAAFFEMMGAERVFDPAVVVPTEHVLRQIDDATSLRSGNYFCVVMSPSGGLRGSIVP